ncbi:hypothetical protein LHYA1_G007352 [Lachnellula hyalina]|uniref:F-box domain-containing protein n=1 Tax=Lachnellula hyalina TaxID=1316788 RepID=A0A8H8QYY9_9HELO|nr:uncharacterized protein LHYA1_G007352 [Lachnellula hyalina]TVY25051.1 hypothetical protein LHYA1_G007352 [Lachnellula hyalina]
MASPRTLTRPGSAGSSSTTSRSSFESRHKSPLSVSSSADYNSSRTSQDSSFSNDAPVHSSTNKWTSARRSYTEPIVKVSSHSQHSDGGKGRRKTLMTPQRLSKRPQSPTGPSIGTKYTPKAPGEGFGNLPEEILLVVLAELKKVHLDAGSLSCSTCWMRDLASLSLSCKKWWGAARTTLYEDVQLIGNDSILHTKKKLKMKYGTRLKLLRRTLRARPDLAEYVKILKVPAMPDAAKNKKDQDEYLDQVASVIMACPNLERLPGFHPAYTHEFPRFVHALSTRKKLQERVWIISESPFQRQHRYKASDDSDYLTPVIAPNSLLPEQSIDFLMFHSNWSHLKTLVLHCNQGGIVDSPLLIDTLKQLPALENLHVSSFSESSFNDTTLLSLPPLRSLRLDNLAGVTDNGLSSFASAGKSNGLKTFSLNSLPLLSLPVLARLFSHLKSLTHFTVSQVPSPSLPTGVDIFLHPYLASSTLQYLHWEFTNPGDTTANEILSKAISFSGFPALRTLRAPTDSDGSLQKLCKPRDRIELSGDRYRNGGCESMPSMPFAAPTRPFSAGNGQSGPRDPTSQPSLTRSAFSMRLENKSQCSAESNVQVTGMSLSIARMTAQRRIDTAVSAPQYHIIIWDPEGQFLERFAVGGFIGDLGSKINYSLRPDVDGMDEAICRIEGAGGLLQGGDETNLKDNCTGSWNMEAGERSKGKGKDRWWHTERGRWREMPLEKLF